MTRTKKPHELLKHFLCTIGVLMIYLIGRNIPLFQIDQASLMEQSPDMQNLLMSMVSGDRFRCSVFALGIMPYLTISIILQFVVAFLPKGIKKRLSMSKVNQITLIATAVYAALLAVSRAKELSYTVSRYSVTMLQWISIIEMTAGTMLLVGVLMINKEHGIGQMVPVVMVNIIEGIYTAINGNEQYFTPSLFMICGVIMIITLMMENVELHIPVQRVSIHNIYADKDYITFKLNPIGIMPVMFSTSIFMMFKYLLYFLGGVFEENHTLTWINAHMDLSDKFGIGMYLLTIFIFAILFSFVVLTPKTMAENLQKGGDSIVGIYAGRPTVRYLTRTVFLLACLSGTVFAVCMGVSMYSGLEASMPNALAMLPSSLMIIISILANLIDEIRGYHKFDAYRFFV